MRRRSLFAGVGATVGLAGCLGRFTGRETVEEKPSPDPPDDLTRESVLEYVRTAEKAHVHNEAVDDDVNDVSVACEPFLDRVVDGTFYVVVHCGGSVEWRDGWLAGHGDIRTTSTVLVSDDGGRRFGEIGYRPSSRFDGGPRLLVANFDDGAHAVAVTIPRADDGEPAFRETIALEAGTARTIPEIGADGPSELVAALDGGASETYRWRRTEPRGENEVSPDGTESEVATDGDEEVADRDESAGRDLGVYVTPDGRLDVNALRTRREAFE